MLIFYIHIIEVYIIIIIFFYLFLVINNINLIIINLDKGLHEKTFTMICEKALSIWKTLGGGQDSANLLMIQLLDYSLSSKPYNYEFDFKNFTVKNWWLLCRQKKNYIQYLALMINSITPYNVSCERMFLF